MKSHIGGALNLEALRLLHRPQDVFRLGEEVRRLAREGLKPRDIAQALGMPLPDVLAAIRGIEGRS